MGADKFQRPDQIPVAGALFDDYFERGGNCFDVARIYGEGAAERTLGWWIMSRGIRDEVIVVAKGAHTPNCNPDALTRELHASLADLGVDQIDLYLMHRDNVDIEVGEFVDVLDGHRRAGLVRAYGVSNWTLARVLQFNERAAARGATPIAAVSNQLSLATMMEPPWAGCLSAAGPDFRAFLEASGTLLLPWSSQARGFFTDRSSPEDASDPELARCWYSEDNFARKSRAGELAERLGVSRVAVALAWVLNQPFQVLPLIGPVTAVETADSFRALDVSLTVDELAWLESGAAPV